MSSAAHSSPLHVFTAAIVALVYVPMVVEAWLASANERAQRERGGIEATHAVYRIMRIAYPVTFLAMIVEHASSARPAPDLSAVSLGFVLFIAAKGLKWWAITTLGPFWTFRVIVVPGAKLVASGPYRFLRHPNYVAVIGELIAVAFATKARIAGPVSVLVFGALILRRIAVEDRALGRI